MKTIFEMILVICITTNLLAQANTCGEDFTWSPVSPTVGQVTSFFGDVSGYSGCGCGGPFTYDWNSNGGSPATSSLLDPTFTFPLVGVYTVCFEGVYYDADCITICQCIDYACYSVTVTDGLPIKLTFFKGKNAGNKNVLEWTTASEMNNDYFVIERKSEGEWESEWEMIGQLKGAGNSTTIRNYEFVDNSPFPKGRVGDGLLYYRLKQMDFDGNYTYSKVVTVNQTQSDNLNTLFSSEKNIINCLLTSSVNEKISINLIDILGRKVITETSDIKVGENKLSLDISKYPTGMYVIQLITESGKYQTFLSGRQAQKQVVLK